MLICLLALAIVLLSLAGPRSVSVPIAALTIGEDNQRVVLSGHRFQCVGQDPQEALVRCTTSLMGQQLKLEFTYGNRDSAVLTQCNLIYGQQVLECSGGYDYRASRWQPFVYLADGLGLTRTERWLLWLENPLVNIPEASWHTLNWSVAAVVSILLGLSIWLKVKLRSIWRIMLVSVSTAALVLPAYWLTLVLLVFTGYVD